MVKKGVKIIHCGDKNEASEKALKLLLENVDAGTLLLLSGGNSPGLLYQLIAQDRTLKPGAVALIDERFGLPGHDNSNEKMVSETGLVTYLNNEVIPFYGILTGDDMEVTAEKYEQAIKGIFKKFPKKVAIMGIGTDGHTAGIKPNLEYDHQRMVIPYDDKDGPFGKRITLTWKALGGIDKFVILAFGQNKQKALQSMFQKTDQKFLPAVFFTKVPIKTVLFTDIDKF